MPAVFWGGTKMAGPLPNGSLPETRLSESRRRDIFRLLVTGQDYGMSVIESRQMASETSGVALSQVVQIEHEGMANKWPPL